MCEIKTVFIGLLFLLIIIIILWLKDYCAKLRMCVIKSNPEKCKMINRSQLGRAVRGVLTRAKDEGRLICGLFPAISHLEKSPPDDVLFCVLPQIQANDAGTHMQTVLLQAFCYENCIPVIQVNSSEKLAKFCGLKDKSNKGDFICAIVLTKDDNDSNDSNMDYCSNSSELTANEQILTDFYECSLEEFPRPVVELPI